MDDLEDWRTTKLLFLKHYYKGLSNFNVQQSTINHHLNSFYNQCINMIADITPFIKSLLENINYTTSDMPNLLCVQNYNNFVLNFSQKLLRGINVDNTDELSGYVLKEFTRLSQVDFKKVPKKFKPIQSKINKAILQNELVELYPPYKKQQFLNLLEEIHKNLLFEKFLNQINSTLLAKELEATTKLKFPEPLLIYENELFKRATEIFNKLKEVYEKESMSYIESYSTPVSYVYPIHKSLEIIGNAVQNVLPELAEYSRDLCFQLYEYNLEITQSELYEKIQTMVELNDVRNNNFVMELSYVNQLIQRYNLNICYLQEINSKISKKIDLLQNETTNYQLPQVQKIRDLINQYNLKMNSIIQNLTSIEQILSFYPSLSPKVVSINTGIAIATSLPEYTWLIQIAKYLLDKLNSKNSIIEDYEAKIEIVKQQNELGNEIFNRICGETKCQLCILEPVAVPKCGHTMCQECISKGYVACPVCGIRLGKLIPISWEF